MKTIIFLTEGDLLNDSNHLDAATIFAGGDDELIECQEQGYIPDLLTRDPDYIRIDEETIPFIELRVGERHYVVSDEELNDTQQRWITALLDNDNHELIDVDNTWDSFRSGNNIAFRGGRGYNYSIWRIPTEQVA